MTKSKNGKKASETTQSSTFDVTEVPPLFSDTTCTINSSNFSWETMYQLPESEGSRIIQSKATTDATTSSKASHFKAASSFLHRIFYIHRYGKMDNRKINISDQAFQTSR